MATTLDYTPMYLAGTQGIGAFGLKLEEDGGLVADARMTVGYGRRSLEAIALQLPLAQALNYMDRLDYLAAPAFNFALASACEDLLRIEISARSEQIRLILLELNRIASHLHYYGNLARAAGQAAIMNHCLRERERFADIFEMYCGSRLGFGSICLGGVISDATDGWFFKIEKAVASLREFLPDLESSLLTHPFFEKRTRGLGQLDAAMVKNWNITGPNARASGLADCDLRVSRPYGAYRGTEMMLDTSRNYLGDAFDRAHIRKREILQSAQLIESVFRHIPSGNHRIRVGLDVRPAPGKAVCGVEGPRGAIYAMVESDGRSQPSQVSFFCPSAMAVQVLPRLLRGIHAEDAFLVIHSLDISFSEVDK
ncbi:MAG: hypothetical protein AB7K68_05985 [Bacteriovoracia bacterium]